MSITSANSVLMLGVANLFNTPVQIQGFDADDAFLMEAVESGETKMGVDGKLTAGYRPKAKVLEITLMADSPSNDFFDTLMGAEDIAKEKYVLNGTVQLKGTGRLYDLTTGYLKSGMRMPDVKQLLQSRKYIIEFEDVTVAPTP